MTNSLVQMVCNINLAMYGGDMYIAAMTIINSVREVIHMPVSGVGNGAQPVMSFNYGAKEYGRVKQTIRYTAVILLVYTLFAWGMTMLFPNQFVMIFNKDAELLPLTVKSMHIYFFGFFFMAFQFTGQTTFQALGKSKQAIFFSMLRKVIIVVPLTFFTANDPRNRRDRRISCRTDFKPDRGTGLLYYHVCYGLPETGGLTIYAVNRTTESALYVMG